MGLFDGILGNASKIDAITHFSVETGSRIALRMLADC